MSQQKMSQETIRRLITLAALALLSATIALAQAPASPDPPSSPAADTWQGMTLAGPLKDKLFVVTFDHPSRLQTCRVQSFTDEELVCSRTIGDSRAYLPHQVLALILPGDNGVRMPLVLGFNIGLGAAIWGTVVLAGACPPCAVATGVAALLFFGAAGATLIGDDQPNQLLYLAPGQQLSKKLGYVHS